MISLLNRALNFAILPLKLDRTQLLVDFNRFARAVIWQEFWEGRDQEEEYLNPYLKHTNQTYQKATLLQQA